MLIDWLKRTWLLLAVISAALIIFGDGAQLAVTVYRLSAISLVLLVSDFLLTSRAEWGIFPTLDLDEAIDNAQQSPQGAGLLVAAIVALLIAILFLAVPSANATVLDQARPYLPQLSKAIDSQWPAMPLRHIAAGQVEQESGWRPHATLKTSRELGRGLVQMTIAYDSKGNERFNIYRDAVRIKALKGWNWQKDPYNVRCQLTFLVVQDRSNFVQVRPYFVDDLQARKGELVCYNAGPGRWLARRANAKRMGLPSDRWDGGLDRAFGKGECALLYGRPLWKAINEYPDVIIRRSEKYRGIV